MQHFNDNVLNTLKNTKKLIELSRSVEVKKDLTKIAMNESFRFCRVNNYKSVSDISDAMLSHLEDSIWCSFESYGAF